MWRSIMRNKQYPLYEIAPKISSISDMLEQKAETMPDEKAFTYRKGKEKLESKTYAEVYAEVRKAAAYVEKTYGKGKHIAIIGENSYEWLLAYFAVVTSGNVAAPIDKELPADEVEWLVKKADVSTVFVSKPYSDLVENIEGVSWMTLKKLQDISSGEDGNYTLYHPESSELACIIFTSGTSGKSKGVMLSHGNIVTDIYETSRMFNPEAKSTLVVLPLHHAFGLNVAVLMAYNFGVTIFKERIGGLKIFALILIISVCSASF